MKCVGRYCQLANKTTQQLYKVSTPCLDDHHFKEEELKSVGELSKVCSQIVLKCLYLARIGRPDFLWSVNKLARSITKWTKACDKRLSRLISYIHYTSEYKQYCHAGNTNLLQVEHCVFSEATRLFQLAGCVRNNLQFHTAQQNQKSFPWMQDGGWTVVTVLHGNTHQNDQVREDP